MENKINKSNVSETRQEIETLFAVVLSISFLVGSLIVTKKALKNWRENLIEIHFSNKPSFDSSHSITFLNVSDYHYKTSAYLMFATILVVGLIISYLMARYFSIFRFYGNYRNSIFKMTVFLAFFLSIAPVTALWGLAGGETSSDYQKEVNTSSLSSWSESRYGVSLDKEQIEDLLPENGHLDNRDFKNGTGNEFETRLSDGRIVKLSPTGKPYTYNLVEVNPGIKELPLKSH